MKTPLKVFISYSHNHNDRPLLDQLLKQAAPLIQAGKITIWEDAQISPGDIWDEAIKKNLQQADIVILLVSSDYSASDYINKVEVPMAMQQQAAGQSEVIPVLLRSCLFELMPYARYEFLPKTADNQRLVPVDKWDNTDEAFAVVVRRLHALIQQITGGIAADQNLADRTTPIPDQIQPTTLSDLERKGYEQQLTLATQKLQRLQTAHLLETDASRQFAYEHEIQQLEAMISDLKSKW